MTAHRYEVWGGPLDGRTMIVRCRVRPSNGLLVAVSHTLPFIGGLRLVARPALEHDVETYWLDGRWARFNYLRAASRN